MKKGEISMNKNLRLENTESFLKEGVQTISNKIAVSWKGTSWKWQDYN